MSLVPALFFCFVVVVVIVVVVLYQKHDGEERKVNKPSLRGSSGRGQTVSI